MNLTIPQTSGHSLSIPVEDGEHLFMVGANGSGKSALIQHLVSSHGNDKIRRIAAHRQTAFHSDRANFTYPDRGQFEKQIKNWDMQPDARWKEEHQFGQQKHLAIFSDLIDNENFQARSVRDLVRDDDIAKAREASSKSASRAGAGARGARLAVPVRAGACPGGAGVLASGRGRSARSSEQDHSRLRSTTR